MNIAYPNPMIHGTSFVARKHYHIAERASVFDHARLLPYDPVWDGCHVRRSYWLPQSGIESFFDGRGRQRRASHAFGLRRIHGVQEKGHRLHSLDCRVTCGLQRYLGHDGKADPQDGEDDAVRADRGSRPGDGVLLRFPDDQSHKGQLQTTSTSSGGWGDRQERILIPPLREVNAAGRRACVPLDGQIEAGGSCCWRRRRRRRKTLSIE